MNFMTLFLFFELFVTTIIKGPFTFTFSDNWKWNNVTVSYTNWIDGEPNGYGAEDCVEFTKWANGNALWNDQECDSNNHFICEMDLKAAH